MSLRPHEIQQIAQELSSKLAGAVLQKVFVTSSEHCFLELRLPGRSLLLSLSCHPHSARVSVVQARPTSPPRPLAFQGKLRRDLLGFKLVSVVQAAPRRLVWGWQKREQVVYLVVDLSNSGGLALLNVDGHVLASLSPHRSFEVTPFSLSPFALGSVDESRLQVNQEDDFPYLRAAELLLGPSEEACDVEVLRRARLAPLKTEWARNERTLMKVQAEAHREDEARALQSKGELLSRNMHLWQRGRASIELVDYTSDGPVTRHIELDPKLSPQEEVEKHFRQYRRLMRGSAHAQRRLAELEQAQRVLGEKIEYVRRANLETLRAEALPQRLDNRKVKAPTRARPFHEFVSKKGQKIWVGKNARSNDELTFGCARPHDLWLHVRGVSGSHVVVPLEKNQELDSDVLLDAALLAMHFSSAKGETLVEVSYTPVKCIRRVKGGAPGKVLVTQEKTIRVRADSDRIVRLLASRNSNSN